MALIFWNDNLSVGNKFMDHDHRHLIGLLNNLHIAMGEGRCRDVLGPALNDIVRYTREHFKREEDVMQDMHYAEFLEHKEAHDKLIREVLEMQKNFMAGETKLAADLLQFLFEQFMFDWLSEHIVKLDKELAQAIHAAESGAKDQIGGVHEQRPECRR